MKQGKVINRILTGALVLRNVGIHDITVKQRKRRLTDLQQRKGKYFGWNTVKYK